MTFLVILTFLTGLMLVFSGVQHQSISDFASKWISSNG